MEASNFLLKVYRGKHSTLDKDYNKHISYVLKSLDEELEIRWETYNLIINQLQIQTKVNYIMELKYRLTDGESINDIILDILERQTDNFDSLVWFLKKRVEEYKEEDFFKRFL